ncbi:MAG: hypothetical protein JMN27_15665 [gamma proteobacterium endosymbiont of Lamellibrachia anaximandri]|nr:hypothetical protein [gamma proteobacterium endosymbiont of Lamellibrachia anaximandri]MBL3535250.1 hypothetical protein [gamma proteobacterium endosymbiont of Lamellibrachia anaximandri]
MVRKFRKIGRGGKYDSLVGVEKSEPITSEDDPKIAAEKFDKWQQRTVSGDIDHLENYAKKVLKKAGLPTEFGPFPWPDGREGSCSILDYVDQDEPSPERSATQVVFRAYALRKAMKSGNIENVVYNALRLQSAYCHIFIQHWEYPTRVGEVQLTGIYATDYSKEEKENWISLAKELFLSPSFIKKSQRAIANEVAERLLAKASTVRAHFQKHNIPKKWL